MRIEVLRLLEKTTQALLLGYRAVFVLQKQSLEANDLLSEGGHLG